MLTHNVPEAWSELNVARTQVLLCDLQIEIVARSKTTPPDSPSQSVDVLCQVAQLFDLPLTLSVVPEGEKPPHLIPPLQLLSTGSNQFARASANPFLDPATRDHLAAAARPILVLAGFQLRLSFCMRLLPRCSRVLA